MIRVPVQSTYSGGINLIADGTVARVSKIAVASSSYEHRVSLTSITKKICGAGFAWNGSLMAGW